jgi:hypothetical protein
MGKLDQAALAGALKTSLGPDVLLVTGSLYNGDNKYPFDLPGNKNASKLLQSCLAQGIQLAEAGP